MSDLPIISAKTPKSEQPLHYYHFKVYVGGRFWSCRSRTKEWLERLEQDYRWLELEHKELKTGKWRKIIFQLHRINVIIPEGSDQ